jgi:hypothetical protein
MRPAIVFDVPAYPEGRHISNLYLDRRAAAEALETSQIKRYTVPLNGKDVTGEILFDEFAELPTIDYGRDAGLDYGTAHAAGGRKDRPGRVLQSTPALRPARQSGTTLVR